MYTIFARLYLFCLYSSIVRINDKWKHRFFILGVSGGDITVLLPSPVGPTRFWSIVMKVYYTPIEPQREPSCELCRAGNIQNVSSLQTQPAYIHRLIDLTLTQENNEVLEDNKNILHGSNSCSKSNYHKPHATHWREKVNYLIDRDIFSIVLSSNANGHWIYGHYVSDYVENVWKMSTFAKSRRIVQDFNKRGHGFWHNSNCSKNVSANLAQFRCY